MTSFLFLATRIYGEKKDDVPVIEFGFCYIWDLQQAITKHSINQVTELSYIGIKKIYVELIIDIRKHCCQETQEQVVAINKICVLVPMVSGTSSPFVGFFNTDSETSAVR